MNNIFLSQKSYWYERCVEIMLDNKVSGRLICEVTQDYVDSESFMVSLEGNKRKSTVDKIKCIVKKCKTPEEGDSSSDESKSVRPNKGTKKRKIMCASVVEPFSGVREIPPYLVNHIPFANSTSGYNTAAMGCRQPRV